MVFTMCCLAAGRTRRLMNPLPATSARSSHSEGGSAATSSSASSRGLRFSTRASCIAAGQEKSPCCDCLGRSREISEPGCCGATLASARRSEEHTSELQSQFHLVCRLLLENKKSAHSPAQFSFSVSSSIHTFISPRARCFRLRARYSPCRRACSARDHGIFFFNDPSPSEIYTLSLHDALPI